MSFRSRAAHHDTTAPGFSHASDPFAGLASNIDDVALNFDDTYDGLGDYLEETGDVFNDDTFGGGGKGSSSVGKDFDFFGQTAKVADAIEEEHLRFNRQKPLQKPTYTGYEKYKETEPVPDLNVDLSLWGMAPPKPAPQAVTMQPGFASAALAAGRKMMSLDEVEAMMRAQSKTPQQPHETPPRTSQASLPTTAPEHPDFLYAKLKAPQQDIVQQDTIQVEPATKSHTHHTVPGPAPPIQILQRPHTLAARRTSQAKRPQSQPSQADQSMLIQPTKILQNPNRLSGDASRIDPPMLPTHRAQGSGAHTPREVQALHVPQISDQDKAAYLEQETKRAKRNHKIWLLSRDNGFMTPQDKNFITRIQLQQLVTATGVPIEHGDDESLNDDFYYQVHTSIRGGQRQNPSQPLHNFAQTYLYQTGSRQAGSRRQARAAENHVQRMEQQVQRAVEAAKNKPKNPQLVIAGSLGKIAFSNAKTPKPLLNIKRSESNTEGQRPSSSRRTNATSELNRKMVLRNIEKVYSTLMQMEDHARHTLPPETNLDDDVLKAKRAAWVATSTALNETLWSNLNVHEPIGATAVHPFIAFLSFNKGKKAIPRVFRHVTFKQRTTILTMIVYHLDQLDVVRGAQIEHGQLNLNAAMREKIELFSLVVMPSLFHYFNETGLDIVDAILELIATKLNLDLIAKTRIGTSMLTLILSRAELLKQAGGGDTQSWAKWDETFNLFFNILEHTLPHIFPGSINSGEDIYVWQLLAAIGVSATPEQQQRLVLAVKDRVLGTVAHAKTLPATMSAQRLSNVNLFMQSIGLDVELLG